MGAYIDCRIEWQIPAAKFMQLKACVEILTTGQKVYFKISAASDGGGDRVEVCMNFFCGNCLGPTFKTAHKMMLRWRVIA